MNEKEKMIEELASDMDFACVELSKEQRIEIARTLINLDYRKITVPIKLTTIGYGKENGCYYADIIATGQEFPQRIYFQASLFEREEIQRETAKEFAERLKEELKNHSPIDGYDLGNLEFDGETIQECIDEIAKKYGVEVEK